MVVCSGGAAPEPGSLPPFPGAWNRDRDDITAPLPSFVTPSARTRAMFSRHAVFLRLASSQCYDVCLVGDFLSNDDEQGDGKAKGRRRSTMSTTSSGHSDGSVTFTLDGQRWTFHAMITAKTAGKRG